MGGERTRTSAGIRSDLVGLLRLGGDRFAGSPRETMRTRHRQAALREL